MKRPEKRQPITVRPLWNHLRQVHPLPKADGEILAVATHLLQQFAGSQGKETPGFSLEAADFLARRRWIAAELARRLWRAVETNRGNLITAADLAES
jgi:DNA-binding NtrC family response regulator